MSYDEDALFSWFNCQEDDRECEEEEEQDITFDQWREYATKVQSLFNQQGVKKFSYSIEHKEGLVTTDGIGVVTASGFAVGIEASPVYWDP
mmetsp:Transcript_84649/g.141577  ORF Transcript_84649/g.141577 Transcript_84649/m.141577 type:complete len:91 (+) Transcript_84649:745-1017(+)